MAAIGSVEIDGFRAFERLRVDGLSPVNLIVGANNSGKTALLEAIEAVVSEQSPFVLYRGSIERGEFQRLRAQAEDVAQIDVRHWFRGHELRDGASFTVRAGGNRPLFLTRTLERLPVDAAPPFVPGGFALTLERPHEEEKLVRLPLTADEFLGAGPPSRFAEFGLSLKPPVAFVTTDRLFPAELARLWTRVELTPLEDVVTSAMRIVEPRVQRIAISAIQGSASAKVLLKGAQRPVPLGTLGEGAARLLTLAIHLVVARGGYLLIDEVENGIHWSAMPALWSLLTATARDLDVQVYATTHSRDCLEGVATLARTQPDLASTATVHRLDLGRETSVRFDASRVAERIELAQEIR